MANWNPNSTGLKGLEWGPTIAGGVVLDSFTRSAVMSVRQTTGQDIGSARVWIGAIPTRGGQYIVEVYDDENCVAVTGQSTLTARPNGDLGGTGTGSGQWRKQDGSAVNVYDAIDEATLNTADSARCPTRDSSWSQYNMNLNTKSIGLAGRRVVSVAVNAIAAKSGDTPRFSIGLYLNSVIRRGQEGSLTSAAKLWTRTWSSNPATGAPWTIADVESLDGGSGAGNYFYVSAGVEDDCTAIIYQAWLDVLTIGIENRLAIGVLDDSFSQLVPNAWNPVTLLTPAGGTWTKEATDWHTFVVRRTGSVGSLVIPTLTSVQMPYPVEGWQPTLNPSTGDATEMGSAKPTAFGLILRTTGSVESVDSQPYASQVTATVYTGRNAEQELSDLAVVNYGGVRAWVKSNDATEPLHIEVRRRSDNTLMGQAMVLTKAQADALPDGGGGWRESVTLMTAGFVAAAGTQYYVRFTSAASGSGNDYWSVLALDTQDQGNGASYGGTTDRALINTVEASRYEIPVTLWTIPAPPPPPPGPPAPALAAVVDTQELPEWTALDCEDCLPLIIEFVHLTWNPTTLTPAFLHYELQRSDDGGYVWATVGLIAQEATTTFDDYETPRGVESQYRLRVWRTDNAYSDWTPVATAPACEAVGGELLFTTNQAPARNCAYNRDGSEPMEFTFLDSEKVVFQQIFGRDYQVAFRGTERHGVAFEVPIIINAVREPTVTLEGLPLFRALRAIATEDIPYVCVLDHYGNRWYAQLQVPTGTHSEPGRLYIAKIIVTEVRGDPTPVTVI